MDPADVDVHVKADSLSASSFDSAHPVSDPITTKELFEGHSVSVVIEDGDAPAPLEQAATDHTRIQIGRTPKFVRQSTTLATSHPTTTHKSISSEEDTRRFSDIHKSSSVITVQAAPVMTTDLAHIIQRWGMKHKRQQKAHEIASFHFAAQFKRTQLPLLILTVLLGSSVVAEMVQSLEHNEHPSEAAKVLVILLSGLLFVLSLCKLTLHFLQDSYWKFGTLSKQHEQRAQIHGQFALKCEFTLGRLRLQQTAPATAPFEAYQMLMTTRQSILEHAKPLEIPNLPGMDFPHGSGTPMFIPYNNPAVWPTPTPVTQEVNQLKGLQIINPRSNMNTSKHTHLRAHRSLKMLVHHVQELAKDNVLNSFDSITTPNSRSISQGVHTSHSVDVSVQFEDALINWQKQAASQAETLATSAHELLRLSRMWDGCRILPSVILQVLTSANLVHDVQAPMENADTTFALVFGIFVVLVLIIRSGMDRLHTVLAFQTRAESADAHQRQLKNFVEQITSVLLLKDMFEGSVDEVEEYQRCKLEELRLTRREIRDQFASLE